MKFDNLAPGLISTPQAHIIPHAFYPNIPFGCVPKYTHEYDKKLILENTALLTWWGTSQITPGHPRIFTWNTWFAITGDMCKAVVCPAGLLSLTDKVCHSHVMILGTPRGIPLSSTPNLPSKKSSLHKDRNK